MSDRPDSLLREAVRRHGTYVAGACGWLSRAWRCAVAAWRCARMERGEVTRPCLHCGRQRYLGRGREGWRLCQEVEDLHPPCPGCGR